MQIRRILSILPILMVCHIIPVTAETLVDGGAVDYNMGAEGLYSMTEFLLVMMHYVTLMLYAIATLTAIVNQTKKLELVPFKLKFREPLYLLGFSEISFVFLLGCPDGLEPSTFRTTI